MFNGDGVSVGEGIRVPELDGSNGYTIMPAHVMPQKCTLKMVNFVYVSPQLKPQIHKNQKAGYQNFCFVFFFFPHRSVLLGPSLEEISYNNPVPASKTWAPLRR